MKIIVTGLRGFPNIQGGVETHCEKLYPRLSKLGVNVTVVRRSCFVKENPPLTSYQGVFFKDLPAPKIKGFESAIHTICGVWYAYKQKADIVHIHAIGPSIAIPFAKLLGLKVVVTHHGPDYDRKNWNFFAKFILKTGEFFAAKWADEIIVISTVIDNILKTKYNRNNAIVIYNGVDLHQPTQTDQYIKSLGLSHRKYILAVGRFVKEKEFDKLIMAFSDLNLQDYHLVIAGDSDHKTSYSTYLKELARKKQVILTGMVKGESLKELYSHAGLFVLPSSHEGLPITLLEAMSYNIDTLVSDIPANLAVGLSKEHYFKVNHMNSLKQQLTYKIYQNNYPVYYDLKAYNWDHIAQQTFNVYNNLLNV